MARIAIIGAGNLGAFIGVHLMEAGHRVFFCTRRDPGVLRVAGHAPVSPDFHLGGPRAADFVILTVKAQDTAAAVAQWLPSLGAGPTAVVQNGVHHARRIAPFPACPVLAYVYVEEQAGELHAYPVPRELFTMPADEEAFAGLFESAGLSVRREPDFHTAAWRKMLHNCVSNPLTALAGRGLEILREPEWRTLAEQILHEALVIAQADGAALTAADAQGVLDTLAAYPAGTRTSMLQDRERNKPLELDALNGYLLQIAEGHPTPVNTEIVRRLGWIAPKRA